MDRERFAIVGSVLRTALTLATNRLTADRHVAMAKIAARLSFFFVILVIAAGSGHARENVLTYHYDNQRTGWNPNERVLRPDNVFGLRREASVVLDDQVDAQPLVLNGVVYVVTENNSVYAINGSSGRIIISANLGPPVSTPPYGCNSGHIGITSTPVIAAGAGILYVMAYTYDGSGNPVFELHALGTGSLADTVAPVAVGGSGTLSNDRPYAFDASVTRQRPALLLSTDGNIYAGFGSFCDTYKNNLARGWLMGWRGRSLTPVGAHLENRNAASTNDFYLTSIWMSGAGIAEDGSANLYFATGNSDPSATSFNRRNNLSESVIELSPDLSTVESFFTPTEVRGLRYLEENDLDMAAGGVLLTPDGYVVAAGKAGQMFLLRQGSLGGRAWRNWVARVPIGICLCTQSYYRGADGAGRIVSSGGDQRIGVWREPSFRLESRSSPLNGGAGFFTSVSSNGTRNAIIWAVDRPANSDPADVTLYAYDPATASVVFSASAGTWPGAAGAHNNTVPVVADGHVYVASYKQLTIWGLAAPSTAVALAHPAFRNPVQLEPGEHDFFGTITAIEGTRITLRRRDGTMTRVGTTGAPTAPLMVGEGVRVVGSGSTTALQAKWVARAQGPAGVWPADR